MSREDRSRLRAYAVALAGARDVVGGFDLTTVTGTPTVSAHPNLGPWPGSYQ